ncbi:Lrp/AsnC family transcriptional regulator [Aliikangiella marina]|uniref:Lrp/AsnC family transcriptional regulator n=1 Tax=Aliikangiella marina TaxID=1712262 RepID=A0A545T8W6_9GAMM|nr:Lrp/AsnC family transcriptional regulator [Aliikangiella marina]TQV73649.1 Lrp/AsnC family transcriptional regulator [Aliikangiella marina]
MSKSVLTGLDWQILEFIQHDGRISISEIAAQLNRSRSNISEHIDKLQSEGIIQGFHAKINAEKLGFGIKAFVRLSAGSLKHREIVNSIIKLPEVLECHVLTGSELVIIQLVAKDMSHLRSVVDGFTQYGSTQTDIVFATVKDGIQINKNLRSLLQD